MVLMGIDKFEHFSKKLNKILDDLDSFCASIESENISSNNSEIDERIEKIKKKIKPLITKMKEKPPRKKQLLFCIIIQLILCQQTK